MNFTKTIKKLFVKPKVIWKNPIYRDDTKYNCARVYVGEHHGDATNTYEPVYKYEFRVKTGAVIMKKLTPIKTEWESDRMGGVNEIINVLVLYPKTQEATILLKGGKKDDLIVHLEKTPPGKRSIMFKSRLNVRIHQ